MSWRDSALILAGHGSTLNGDSSIPTFHHGVELRKRGLFAEVHECFWKEEPSFRAVLRQVETKRAYIVPVFISNGYFTEKVLPREFGLDGRVTQRNGVELYYCDPVGVHEQMRSALLHRAETVLEGESINLADTCLFIAGHGTNLNENSVKIIYQRVEEICAMGIYGECRAFFMEQKPLVTDWPQQTAKRNIIVVPFFIADGLHSYEDIPVMLGISKNVKQEGFRNPTELHGRRLWYARAIGTEPMMADVILAQVRAFDASYRTAATVA